MTAADLDRVRQALLAASLLADDAEVTDLVTRLDARLSALAGVPSAREMNASRDAFSAAYAHERDEMAARIRALGPVQP